MDNEKWLIVGGILVVVFVIEWLRAQAFQNGRLAGIREAVTDVSRSCSYHYEVKDEPLPKKVDEALVYMTGALKRGRGVKGKIELYLIGSGMLGDAMGEAAWQKGFDAGKNRTEPAHDETRIDFTRQDILDLAYMAHRGFVQMIYEQDGFRDEGDANRASESVRKLERHKPRDAVDESDPYALGFNRSTMIWQRFSDAASTGS
jgi:hypothetical protein